jgi:tetratricopeptide (TPR) repeat protein
LTVEPGNTLAQNFFAEILIKQNQYSKAVVHLNQIIRSQPDWWVAYRNKSLALVEEGDIARAIQTYKKGIKLSQETAVLRLDLALLYEKNGQAVEAVTVYEYMLRENQQAYEASNNLAMLLSDAEIFPNGLPRAKELIKALEGEDNPAYLDTIGWVKLKSGDIDSALLALTHAAKKAPNIAMIQYHLGKAYLQAGDQASAHRQLQRAIRLNASFDERADAMALLQSIKSSTSTASVPESID